MLRALLADDELLTVNMMKNLIEWDRFGIEIAATAGSGAEAFAKFREIIPNIIITDIRMPGMNGLEFISRVREISADTEIIVISAYADFTFVKEAMALGCAAYLLKPVDEAELESALTQATRKITEKSLARRLTQKSEAQKKKRAIYDHIVKGAREAAARRAFVSLLGMDCLVSLMIVTLKIETISSYTDVNGLMDERLAFAQEFIEKSVGEDVPCLAFDDAECAWLLIVGTGNTDALVLAAGKARQCLHEESGTDARVCFSSPGKFADLPRLYEQVVEYDKYSQYVGNVDILGSGYHLHDGEFGKAAHYGKLITDALRGGSPGAAISILDEAFRASTAINPHGLSSIYDLCYEVVLALRELPAKSAAAEDGQALLGGIRYRTLTAITSLEELRLYMSKVINAVARPVKEEQYSQLTRDAIGFLSENYSRNISLDDICEHLSISKNYFCYLFKRDTGQSIWARLTDIRMSRAKTLLRETSLRGLEIAYQVGYDNPGYFSKLFKKTFGQTPQEYRTGQKA